MCLSKLREYNFLVAQVVIILDFVLILFIYSLAVEAQKDFGYGREWRGEVVYIILLGVFMVMTSTLVLYLLVTGEENGNQSHEFSDINQ